MCNDLIRILKESRELHCGVGVNPRHWRDALEYADKEWQVSLPEEYGKLLKEVNGIRSDVLQIYGIVPEKGFCDLIEMNVHSVGELILGSSQDDYLCYRPDGSYALVDRHSYLAGEVFASLENALRSWLDL